MSQGDEPIQNLFSLEMIQFWQEYPLYQPILAKLQLFIEHHPQTSVFSYRRICKLLKADAEISSDSLLNNAHHVIKCLEFAYYTVFKSETHVQLRKFIFHITVMIFRDNDITRYF